ncbi:TIGR03621 family F420-dependent LLM class oxidoreductase [Mycolicibacterium vaccae]|uniref:TIGR03621 family F420-dependent LLM class oxidoreductase n=1 Tax=Mycolicibacterium vaccae TaxID=1810 RepID=UPI003CF267A8
MATDGELEFIAPMPRLRGDGAEWVEDLRQLEDAGFDTVAVSHHFTNGWQLAPIAAMAFAAASTSRLRVLSLVVQNPLQHPALLAKDIATIDRLSGGRAELGIGAGWLAEDYTALGIPFGTARSRLAQCAEALTIVRSYFSQETVDFEGEYYRVQGLEALPRSARRPHPPILLGAAGPRMLELAGRFADIVGVEPRMAATGAVSADGVADLTAIALSAKIARVREAAEVAGRQMPCVQYSVRHLDVTDVEPGPRRRTAWGQAVATHADALAGSPAVLRGTAAECAARLQEYSEQFGIEYWHLGQDTRAAAAVIAEVRHGGVGRGSGASSATSTQSSRLGGT